jgi:hypothetical protein
MNFTTRPTIAEYFCFYCYIFIENFQERIIELKLSFNFKFQIKIPRSTFLLTSYGRFVKLIMYLNFRFVVNFI